MAVSMQTLAQRENILINQDWNFRFSHQVDKNSSRRVDLPHTWNAQDALSGKPDYKRGIGNYDKKLFIRSEWKGKRLFLRFEGANCVSNVFINGKQIGEHRGGYGAFIFEITDKVNYGKDNTVLIRVNNGEQLDVMPLVGDFNFYGGIYRDVHLLVTEDICISPLDYASPGVYLFQQHVGEKQAAVLARINLSNGTEHPRQATLRLQVKGDCCTSYQRTTRRNEFYLAESSFMEWQGRSFYVSDSDNPGEGWKRDRQSGTAVGTSLLYDRCRSGFLS